MTRPAIFLAGCALCAVACGCSPESAYNDAYWRGYDTGRADAEMEYAARRPYPSHDVKALVDSTGRLLRVLGWRDDGYLVTCRVDTVRGLR